MIEPTIPFFAMSGYCGPWGRAGLRRLAPHHFAALADRVFPQAATRISFIALDGKGLPHCGKGGKSAGRSPSARSGRAQTAPILRARSARKAACARSFSPCGCFWVPFGCKRYKKNSRWCGFYFFRKSTEQLCCRSGFSRAFRKSTEHSHRCGFYFFRKSMEQPSCRRGFSLYFLPRKYPKRGARTRLGERPCRLTERSRKSALFARSFRALAGADALSPSAGKVRELKKPSSLRTPFFRPWKQVRIPLLRHFIFDKLRAEPNLSAIPTSLHSRSNR